MSAAVGTVLGGSARAFRGGVLGALLAYKTGAPRKNTRAPLALLGAVPTLLGMKITDLTITDETSTHEAVAVAILPTPPASCGEGYGWRTTCVEPCACAGSAKSCAGRYRTPRPRNRALAAVKAAIRESIETNRTVTVRASSAYRVRPGADACFERLERLVGALVLVADKRDSARMSRYEVDAWGTLDGADWHLRLLAYE